MSYRGEDLDLRTPQTWNAIPVTAIPEAYVNGTRARPPGYTNTTPILVDDVVLACCNHAFDVAVAHRAGEVRLEHLLHALTRVEGAGQALDKRGIRVAGLRRESATIIASEIAIGLPAHQARPPHSDDFEQALRTAAAIAYRRNGPANVDDILDSLLAMPSDIPGIALLARHGGRIARDRLSDGRDRDRLSESRDPRDLGREPSRDWDQPQLLPLPPLTRVVSSYSSDSRSAPEQRRPQSPPVYQERPSRPDPIQATIDNAQSARIEQLEQALRALSADLSNDRKADREETYRFRGMLNDRLQSVEQTFLSGSNSGNDDASAFLDRLSAVERGLEQRLNELARPWGVLSDRLQALEQTILETRGAKTSDVALLSERLSTFERSLADKLGGIEKTLTAVKPPVVDLSAVLQRLDMIEEAVLNPSDTGQGVGEALTTKVGALREVLDQQHARAAHNHASLHDKVAEIAAGVARQAANLERSQAHIIETVGNAVAQPLQAHFERQRADVLAGIAEGINGALRNLDGKLQALGSALDTQRNDVIGVITAKTTESQGPLAQLVEHALENRRALDGVSERAASLEKTLVVNLDKSANLQAIHSSELKEVHEALIKLNTNQHTLAGSIDQWRLDGVGDLSVIANRLENIETTAGKPVPLIENLTASVETLNKATIERYHRRHRFYYWLFGTDDWISSSWPSKTVQLPVDRPIARPNGIKPPLSTPVSTVPNTTRRAS